jgi:hypothetical protein
MALDQSTVDSAGLGQQFDSRIFDLEGKSAAQTADVADLQQQESDLSASRAQRARDAAAELKPSSDKLKEAAHKAADEPIQKEERMEPFRRPALDPQELQKTFGMLLVASMFAGKASRSPYNNTMTALTGAMNGFMKEDDHQVAQSLAIYDTNLAAMKERNAALQRDMAANDRKNKNNVAAWTLEHDLILERYDFDDKAAGHEQKSLSDKVKRGETIKSSTEKAIDRLITVRGQIGERHDANLEHKRHDEEMEKVARENAESRKTAAEKSVSTGAVEQLTPEGVKLAGELTRAGITLPGGWSKQGQSRGNAILNAMAAEEKGGAGSGSVVADRAETKGNTAALTQLSKDLASIRPYKVMLDTNANIAKELAQKIIKTDSQLANRPINWLQTHLTDSPDVGEFIAQLHFVTTEAARVLNNPRLVGQLTDNARKDMQDVINENMPLKTTIRILERMQKDGDNRVNAMTKEAAYLKKKIGGSAAMPTAAGENPAAVGGWSVVK